MLGLISQLMFVPVKEFHATNPNREDRRWKTMKQEEIKICCLTAFLPSGIGWSLLSVSPVYRVCWGWLMVGDFWKLLLIHLKSCKLASLWIFALGKTEYHLDQHLPTTGSLSLFSNEKFVQKLDSQICSRRTISFYWVLQTWIIGDNFLSSFQHR